MYGFPPIDHVEEGLVRTNCPAEKKPTEQVYKVIQPMALADAVADPMKMLELSKRIVICTECGNIRLMN